MKTHQTGSNPKVCRNRNGILDSQSICFKNSILDFQYLKLSIGVSGIENLKH